MVVRTTVFTFLIIGFMVKPNNAVEELKQLLCFLLPAGCRYHPVVQKDLQEKELNMLNQTLDNERFYFVFNLLSCKIEQAKGVDRWLGYAAKEFTVERYLNCIASDQSLSFSLIAGNMYRLLCKGFFRLQFSTQRYISLLGLKHYNGDTILFKKTTSVFQYDEKNKLLAQLNVFDKIGICEHPPVYGRTTETNGGQKDHFEEQLFEMILKTFMDKKYFSKKEFEILQCYVQNEAFSSRQVAERVDVAGTTMNVYNRRILEKARTTFTHPFTNAKEVAIYLKKEKLLG